MDLADRGGGERLAGVRSAAVVALVLPGRSVVDLALGLLAVVAAAAKFGLKRVHDAGVEGADLDVAKERADVLVGIALVDVEGVELQVCLRQVLVEQLVDRGLGTRVAALVHLVEQTDSRLLSQLLRGRAGRDDLGQVVPALRDRVDPAYTRTLIAPLGSTSMPPRSRFFRPFPLAMEPILGPLAP